MEKKITGIRAHGFTFRDKIICVTEAKYQKLKEGLAQNVAQMGVVREMWGTKRKIEDISGDGKAGEHDGHLEGDIEPPVYGIVTTGKEWIFSLFSDGNLCISETIANTSDVQLNLVLSLVAGLLDAGKRQN
ncbi:hypothetical protein SEMRO_1045_G234980.1 [Seminavis robusta]|uniref:Uncharacterized protein n=1 Tax=Seminavis robusta TaxID=568900 RepID=A0A9N8EE39_9STRA|nr:hypothetical protein SEMRO_1045_G234980.1 [Seminavis robusta]|eukprot:Sro1045_g234980.1 n/a (131) ;mRNA; f:9479-9871